MLPAVLSNINLYNQTEKRRSFYVVPTTSAVVPFHVWGSLVEKAGYKRSDIPKTWDAFIDFFLRCRKSSRRKGMRHLTRRALSSARSATIRNIIFRQFLIAYGGKDIVTPDGKLHVNDRKYRGCGKPHPRVQRRFIRKGDIPPSR